MSEEPGLIGAISRHAKHAKLVGIVLIVAGVLSIAAPFASGISATIVFGALLLAAGVAECFLAFKAGAFGRGLLIFLVGALTIVAGVFTLKEPLTAMATVTLMLAAYFFVAGILECVAAFSARPAQGWGWLLASGVVSVLLGIMLWRQFPLSGLWAIGTLVGIRLLLAGFALFSIGAAVRKGVKDFASA